MNKSFTFTAILSLVTCFAHAQQMPMLQIELEKKDIEILISVQKQKTLAQKLAQLNKLYPDLEFGQLPGDSDYDGRYVRTYDDTADSRPKILLRSPTPPDALARELIHYFIDRARLAKYPEQMRRERQSYTRMLRAESMVINHKLMSAILHRDHAAKVSWQARLTLNMLERHLAVEGEDIEAITFLIKHREEFGLKDSDLFRQYKQLQRLFDHMSDRATILMEGATQGLNSNLTRMEEVLKWQPLADRLLSVFERLEEIETFLHELSSMENPSFSDSRTCEVLVL